MRKCKHCKCEIKRNGLFCSYKCTIFSKIKINGNSCWEWQGKINLSGYGQIGKRGEPKKQVITHRISYEIFKGEIPKGLIICHSCDNKICCNPDHLWIGTPKDNFHDAMKKGRTVYGGAKGEKSGNAKLNENKVREIREELEKGTKAKILAEHYGVHVAVIYTIKNKKAWKHVK